MKKRVADIVMEILCEKDIKDCFSVVGGGAMHLDNALALCDDIHKIFQHHEQACAMAAEAYARASGKMASVCVTSGPGGLNTLNGVEGAWVDSLPMIVLSGQVRYESSVEYSGLQLRCRGAQEFDIVRSVLNMTKYAVMIKEPLRIRYEMEKALYIAMLGRRGPVWIDIPLDIQSAIVEETDLLSFDEKDKELFRTPEAKAADILAMMSTLKESIRPCILTGSGIRTSNMVRDFREMADNMGIPVVGGALQADIMQSSHLLNFGMSGTLGPRAGNFILQNADVIVVIGNSLSFKQTGFNQEAFAPKAKIIMVEVDEDESRKPGLHITQLIHTDLSSFFRCLKEYDIKIPVRQAWMEYCQSLRLRFHPYEAITQVKEDDRVPAHYFWKKYEEQEEQDSVVALGNSNCVHPRLQSGVKYENQRVLVNYNCGSMGDDLPEAIGAAAALKKNIVCVTGDGSMMMNLQELQTIVHYHLPIKIVVFSNDGYGAIRQTFKNFFGGTYIGCDQKSGVSFPDFEKVADTFGFPFKRCERVAEVEESLRWLRSIEGYAILEILQKLDDPITPKIMSKMRKDNTFVTPALHDMYPFLSEQELNKWMLW